MEKSVNRQMKGRTVGRTDSQADRGTNREMRTEQMEEGKDGEAEQ